MNREQEVKYLKSKYRKLTKKDTKLTLIGGLWFVCTLLFTYFSGAEFTIFNVTVGAFLISQTSYFFIKGFNIQTDQLSEIEAKLEAYGENPKDWATLRSVSTFKKSKRKLLFMKEE